MSEGKSSPWEGHTPGPWKFGLYYELGTSELGTLEVMTSGSEKTICVVNELHKEGEQPATANAELIARAPDLLEENGQLRARLRAAEEALGEISDSLYRAGIHSTIPLIFEHVDAAKDSADKALRRVRGEEDS